MRLHAEAPVRSPRPARPARSTATPAAFTPLLAEPLEGPVYLALGPSRHLLPDLVAVLRGDGRLEIDLDARVDSIRGGMRASFEALPDAPVHTASNSPSSAASRGLLGQLRQPVCTEPGVASARFVGQNNTA